MLCTFKSSQKFAKHTKPKQLTLKSKNSCATKQSSKKANCTKHLQLRNKRHNFAPSFATFSAHLQIFFLFFLHLRAIGRLFALFLFGQLHSAIQIRLLVAIFDLDLDIVFGVCF